MPAASPHLSQSKPSVLERAVRAAPKAPKPRMSPNELRLFRAVLEGKRSYLEFGCGGSTMAVLDTAVERIVSVESDAAWIAKLREIEAVAGAEKSGRLVLQHADIGPTGAWGAPKDDQKIRQWHTYYVDVWTRHGTDYDVVFVDGRFRVACALMTALFVEDGTDVVIHDFTNRLEHYGIVTRHFDVTRTSGTLALLKVRRPADYKSLCLDLVSYSLKST